MNSLRILLVLFFFSVCSLTSCSGRGRLVLTPPEDTVQLSGSTKFGILTNIKASKLPDSLRALLNIEIKSGAGRDFFRQALTFKGPSLFRLEAFATGANALVFIATSEGNEFKAVIPGEKKVIIGKSSPRSLASLIQLPLTPLEMVSLVTGTVFPEFLESNNQQIVKSTDGSIFYTSIIESKRELRIRFNNETSFRITELSLSDGGSGALTARYHYQVAKLKSLTVVLPEFEAEVEIKEITQNVEISSDKIFTVVQPSSYTVKRID